MIIIIILFFRSELSQWLSSICEILTIDYKLERVGSHMYMYVVCTQLHTAVVKVHN